VVTLPVYEPYELIWSRTMVMVLPYRSRIAWIGATSPKTRVVPSVSRMSHRPEMRPRSRHVTVDPPNTPGTGSAANLASENDVPGDVRWKCTRPPSGRFRSSSWYWFFDDRNMSKLCPKPMPNARVRPSPEEYERLSASPGVASTARSVWVSLNRPDPRSTGSPSMPSASAIMPNSPCSQPGTLIMAPSKSVITVPASGITW
jgi:hypothetical protein